MHMSKENYFISMLHGKPSDSDEVKIHCDQFLESIPGLSKVLTASSIVERLIDQISSDRSCTSRG